jgi:hypothetical protein
MSFIDCMRWRCSSTRAASREVTAFWSEMIWLYFAALLCACAL